MKKKPSYEELQKRISELELSGKTLKDSEERYRSLFRNAPLPFQSLDINGCIIDVNQAWLDILGYTRDEVIGKSFGDLLVPSWRNHFREYFPRFKAVGEILGIEFEMVKEDGNAILVTFNCSVKKDESGAFKQAFCVFNDVTQIRKFQQERDQSLSQLRTTLEATADGILVVDRNGKQVLFSKRFAKMWRITDNILESRDDNQVLAFVLDQLKDPDEFLDKVNKLYADLEAKSFDTIEFKDGRIFERYSRPHVLGEEIIGRVWSFRDVTEQKLTEKALKESEARMKALSDASFEAIFISDKGVCLDQNLTAEKMFGYSNTEAIGRQGTEWIVPEDREQVKNNMLSGYEKPYEVTALRKDGTTFPCEIQARMTCFQDRPVRVTALRNISDRKNAERALHKSEEKYRVLFESSKDAVYINTVEGVFVDVNQSFLDLLGYSWKELSDLTAQELYANPQDRSKFKQDIEQHGFVKDYALKLQKKDGTAIDCLLTAVPRHSPDGFIVGYQGIIRDVTEKLKMEAELKASRKQMQDLSGQLLYSIEKERKSISYKIHDDIGQILTALKMDAKWVQRHLTSKNANLSDKIEKMTELIDSSIQTVKRISSDLRPDILDNLGLSEAIDGQVQEFINRTGLNVQFENCPEDLELKPEIAIVVYRIVQEGLTNIIRHAKAKNVFITFTVYPEKLELQIMDDGIGFMPEDICQSNRLGIVGMQERARLSDGTLNVTGGPNKGTKLELQIPIG